MSDTDSVIDPFATYTSISEMASLWLTGAVGLACGIGYYVVAGLATVLALFILVFVRVIERVMPTDDMQPAKTDKHAEADGKTGEVPAEA